ILLRHRSALEYRPTRTEDIFLTLTHNRKVRLPGVTLNIMRGPGVTDGDNLFTDGLYVSGQERALLENLQESRKVGGESKTLPLPEIEEKLDRIVRVKAEDGLNELRDRARQVAAELSMEKEFGKLDRMVGAILSTKPTDILKSPVTIARAFGHPYDPARMEVFEQHSTGFPPFRFLRSLFFQLHRGNALRCAGSPTYYRDRKAAARKGRGFPRRTRYLPDCQQQAGNGRHTRRCRAIAPDTPLSPPYIDDCPAGQEPR